MKHRILLSIGLALCLPSCSSPFAGPDQLDIGIANAAMQQPAHAAEVSRSMAAASIGRPAGSIRLQPLAPLQPLR